jgi:HD-like signal output (HDOD) protein
VILKDMALTTKVLKLLNAPFYRHFSNRGSSTISEAMIILGTDEVRLAAAGMKIYEMMSSLGNVAILKQKTLKGLQRSIMARQIVREDEFKEADAIQIAAMLYDLGEYMVALFAPEKYIRIELAMDEHFFSRAKASKSILGLSYSDLGMIVALKLHLPKNIVNDMRPVTDFCVNWEGLIEGDRHRYVCAFVNEMCNIPLDDEGCQDIEQAQLVVEKYNDILNLDMSTSLAIFTNSWDKMIKHEALLNISPSLDLNNAGPGISGVKNQERLNAGLKQLEQNLDKQLSIHEIFTSIVETLFKSFYFTQVCIAIKKNETQMMDARFAKGDRSKEFLKWFSYKIENSQDLFNEAIMDHKDIIITEITRPEYEKKIPAWYRDRLAGDEISSAIAVFPVFVDQKIIAMICVNWNNSLYPMNQRIVDYINNFRSVMVKIFTLHGREPDNLTAYSQ